MTDVENAERDSEQIKRIFRQYDTNGDGGIDVEELTSLLISLLPSMTKPSWRTDFSEAFQTPTVPSSHLGRYDFKGLFKALDQNHDGRIDVDEFVDFLFLNKGLAQKATQKDQKEQKDQIVEQAWNGIQGASQFAMQVVRANGDVVEVDLTGIGHQMEIRGRVASVLNFEAGNMARLLAGDTQLDDASLVLAIVDGTVITAVELERRLFTGTVSQGSHGSDPALDFRNSSDETMMLAFRSPDGRLLWNQNVQPGHEVRIAVCDTDFPGDGWQGPVRQLAGYGEQVSQGTEGVLVAMSHPDGAVARTWNLTFTNSSIKIEQL